MTQNRVQVRFRDGKQVTVNRENVQVFLELMSRNYNERRGFQYTRHADGTSLVAVPGGPSISVYDDDDYSCILTEVFYSQVYGRQRLDGRLVVDVGAGVGDTSIMFALQGAKMVYAFEPDKRRLGLARKNVLLNNVDPKVTLFDDAVEDFGQLKSILDKSEAPIENAFLKLDCEGCEYGLIMGVEDPGPLDWVSSIVLEYHDGSSGLARKLSTLGFDVRINRRRRVLTAERRPTPSQSGD